MLRAWRRPLAAAAFTAVLASTGSAQAASPAPAPRPVVGSAAELQSQAEQQAAVLAAEQAAAQQADAAATAALESYQVAARRAGEAQRADEAEQLALVTAQQRTARAQETLARYLGSVYRTGVGNRRLSVISDLIDAEDPQALFTGLSIASRVGGNRNDQLDALHASQEEQRQATERAGKAAEAARTATEVAQKAKVAADAAVAQQKARVAAAAVQLAATQQAAAVAAAREAALAKAEIIARSRSAVPPLAALEGALVVRPTAGCTGKSTAGYPNGMIPTDVLCPLWGTSGQMLRADAAAAFNAMSKLYAETFEAPVCVTDSYRSYPEQVAVRAAKPTLAAVPGSSNHGWGVALDLCDGIQGFGSPQHQWMQQNAMAFGWFHPAWAQQGGSKPEAWHWEYAG